MVPAQNRPAGSTLPSLARVSGSSASHRRQQGQGAVRPGRAPRSRSGVMATRPPEARSTTQPSGRATSTARSVPSSDVAMELPALDVDPPHDAVRGVPGRALPQHGAGDAQAVCGDGRQARPSGRDRSRVRSRDTSSERADGRPGGTAGGLDELDEHAVRAPGMDERDRAVGTRPRYPVDELHALSRRARRARRRGPAPRSRRGGTPPRGTPGSGRHRSCHRSARRARSSTRRRAGTRCAPGPWARAGRAPRAARACPGRSRAPASRSRTTTATWWIRPRPPSAPSDVMRLLRDIERPFYFARP